MIRLFCFLSLVAITGTLRAAGPIQVACVGDSITQGVGTRDPATGSYPAQLQKLLGPSYAVHNYGVGGRTMLRKADPFDHHRALKSQPEVVIIALGTNDSKTGIWSAHKDEFAADYVAMVREFQALPSHPTVWACLPPPAFPGNWSITETIIHDEVIPAIQKAAQITGIKIIDLHTPLLQGAAMFPDKVHPNEEGAARIAATVAKAVAKP